VEQKGWILDAYKINPVILWSHNHSIPAIGIAENLNIIKDLQGVVTFDEEDPFSASILSKVKRGIIKAGSVGFLPLEIEWVEDKDAREFFRYTKQELVEFSICNVPANPFALIQQYYD
jgi:HK97 family phage prohead protease